MNRGLIVGAGVLGIGLAVLLIQMPGGGDGGGTGVPTAAPTPQDLGPAPKDDGLPSKPRDEVMARPTTTKADGTQTRPHTARDIPDDWKVPGPNASAAERQKLRDTPEGHVAVNQQSPFSRAAQLLRQGGNDELADEATDLVRELREYNVFPHPENFPALQARIQETSLKIRDAGLEQGEMAAVLAKVDEHLATYEAELAAAEVEDEGAGEPAP